MNSVLGILATGLADLTPVGFTVIRGLFMNGLKQISITLIFMYVISGATYAQKMNTYDIENLSDKLKVVSTLPESSFVISDFKISTTGKKQKIEFSIESKKVVTLKVVYGEVHEGAFLATNMTSRILLVTPRGKSDLSLIISNETDGETQLGLFQSTDTIPVVSKSRPSAANKTLTSKNPRSASAIILNYKEEEKRLVEQGAVSFEGIVFGMDKKFYGPTVIRDGLESLRVPLSSLANIPAYYLPNNNIEYAGELIPINYFSSIVTDPTNNCVKVVAINYVVKKTLPVSLLNNVASPIYKNVGMKYKKVGETDDGQGGISTWYKTNGGRIKLTVFPAGIGGNPEDNDMFQVAFIKD